MTSKLQTQNPRASWGHVVTEALRAPFKSGAASVALGTADIVWGTAMRDPVAVVLGVGLDAMAGPRLVRFVKNARYGRAAPTIH